MTGIVIKIFSDFYYVDTQEGVIEAKLRGVLKKRGTEVYTGSYVKLEQTDKNSMQAFISDVLPNKTLLSRPKTANVTKIIIVSALKEPDLDFEQLNRYIAHAEYHKIEPVLCFNKEDLVNENLLERKIENIYKPLGYKIFFVSALEKTGVSELKAYLKNSTGVLTGASGAGKSSLINAMLNNGRMKTGAVSLKTGRGMHTTRHTELIKIDDDVYLADTPGFSRLKFDFLQPSEIQNLFAEFKGMKGICAFKNCLHTGETGCAFENIIQNMDVSRYESYKTFVREAKEYEEKISRQSVKNESRHKYNKNKIMVKISDKKRELNRRTARQRMYKEDMTNE